MIDPVCGMSVEPDEAEAAWEHDGSTFYFCSVRCMEAFRADPDRYLRGDASERRMPPS